MRAFSTALFVLAASALAAAAKPYTVDKDHTQITFQVNHLGFSMIHGQFRDFEMTIDFEPDDIEATQVEIVVDPASIETFSETRDTHARTYKDLFDVARFPEIRFVSRMVELTSAETARITGDLTIRDVTRSVDFFARLNRIGPSPFQQGSEVIGFTVTGEVDRTQFGMGFAAPAVAAVVPIKVEIEIFAPK